MGKECRCTVQLRRGRRSVDVFLHAQWVESVGQWGVIDVSAWDGAMPVDLTYSEAAQVLGALP